MYAAWSTAQPGGISSGIPNWDGARIRYVVDFQSRETDTLTIEIWRRWARMMQGVEFPEHP